VRSLLRERGKSRAVWVVPEAAEPSGLATRLLALGFEPWDEDGGDPRLRLMATVEPPASGPPDVIARAAGSADEIRGGIGVAGAAFGESDGEVVGYGRAIFADDAVHLLGGSTRRDMRGRGVCRALLRARWDAAVARGTPALTVEAQRTSSRSSSGSAFGRWARLTACSTVSTSEAAVECTRLARCACCP
jgi:hypothetical protein